MRGICLFVVGRYKKFNSLTDNCASQCPTNRPACLSADGTRVPQPCSCTYELINFTNKIYRPILQLPVWRCYT